LILRDADIRDLVRTVDMLNPFTGACLNSYGYDLCLGKEFKIPKWSKEISVVDPFEPPEFLSRVTEDFVLIPPGGFVLGHSKEYVRMPGNVTGICLGRSTYARAGVLVHVTPLEAGWEGVVTIEISNTGSLPVKVWVDRGITQVIFFRGEYPLRDYVSKGGRYQGQTGVTQGRP